MMTKTNSPIPHITHFQVSTHWDSDEKIRLIETFPDSDSILVIWFKLLAMCARQEADGNIKFPPEIDLSPKNLSIMLSRPENTVKLAIELFTRFNMISMEDHNVTLLNWPKHQHFDALERIKLKARERVKRFRDKQKQLSLPSPLASNKDCNVTDMLPVTLCNAGEERRGEEKRRDSNNNIITCGEFKNVKLSSAEYQKLVNKFGKESADTKIDAFSVAKASKGLKYKNDYATILNWARRDDGKHSIGTQGQTTAQNSKNKFTTGKYGHLVKS